jgi:hypothetical protein
MYLPGLYTPSMEMTTLPALTKYLIVSANGINLTAYSSVKIYGNEISDCALYAVEMENFPNVASPVPTKYAFCGYNLIRRCGRAIAVVGILKRISSATWHTTPMEASSPGQGPTAKI